VTLLPPRPTSLAEPLPSILILKTGALGDVLRTTSILPGLLEREPGAAIEWVTAPAAVELVSGLSSLAAVHVVSPKDAEGLERLGEELAARAFDWVISLDAEEPPCRLASRVAGGGRLSGAYWDEAAGCARYTEDVAPWFDMGLLSVHGKEAADRLIFFNDTATTEIYTAMLGISMGRPELPLPEAALAFADAFAERNGLDASVPLIGLNTGAGGRWTSKQLPEERVVELARAVHEALAGKVRFLLLGGPEEAERNARILAGLRATPGTPADALEVRVQVDRVV